MQRIRLPLVALCLALVLLAAAGMFWSRARPRAYAPQGPGDIYLALGDSLAAGLRLDSPASESYPALIRAQLAGRGPIELANLAVPGETSASMLRRQLPRALALIVERRAAGQIISPITIDIGGNDLRNVQRADDETRAAAVADVGKNLGKILDDLRTAAGPRADIVVMQYYNPYGGDPAVPGSDAYWVAQLNAAIGAAASPRGAALADTYGPLGGGRAYTHTFILLGDIHANARGHAVIAESFRQALAYP